MLLVLNDGWLKLFNNFRVAVCSRDRLCPTWKRINDVALSWRCVIRLRSNWGICIWLNRGIWRNQQSRNFIIWSQESWIKLRGLISTWFVVFYCSSLVSGILIISRWNILGFHWVAVVNIDSRGWPRISIVLRNILSVVIHQRPFGLLLSREYNSRRHHHFFSRPILLLSMRIYPFIFRWRRNDSLLTLLFW